MKSDRIKKVWSDIQFYAVLRSRLPKLICGASMSKAGLTVAESPWLAPDEVLGFGDLEK